MVTLPLHVGFHDLTPDRSMNFQLNRWINYRAETLLPDVSRIAPQLTSYRAWITVFLELPERALAEGRALDAAFHTRSAEFFMLPNDPRRRDCRERFVTLMREGYGVGARHAFRTPYAGVGLPGYRLTPPVARETIVLFGGFDSYIEEFLPVLLLLRDAGFDVVAFEGPGQGAVLEDAGLPMTPDWHRPVGAVLDHLGHANVTLVGVSLGGCLAIRAAALEPRVARVVAFDVLTDFFESLTVQTPPVMRVLLKTLMRVRARHRDRRAACPCRAAAARGRMGDLASDAPVRREDRARSIRGGGRLQDARDLAAGYPGRAAMRRRRGSLRVHQLYDQARWLTRARSVATRVFSRRDHAHNHCQVGNLGLALHTIGKWIDAMVTAPGSDRPQTGVLREGSITSGEPAMPSSNLGVQPH